VPQGEEVKGAARDAADTVRDAARSTADATRDAAARGAGRASEAAGTARDNVRSAAGSARRGAADVAHSVKEGAEAAGDAAAEKAGEGFFMWKARALLLHGYNTLLCMWPLASTQHALQCKGAPAAVHLIWYFTSFALCLSSSLAEGDPRREGEVPPSQGGGEAGPLPLLCCHIYRLPPWLTVFPEPTSPCCLWPHVLTASGHTAAAPATCSITCLTALLPAPTQEASHLADEATHSAKHAAHNVAEGAKHGAQAAGAAAHDAKEWTKDKAGVSHAVPSGIVHLHLISGGSLPET
jgi:hypothetical protein